MEVNRFRSVVIVVVVDTKAETTWPMNECQGQVQFRVNRSHLDMPLHVSPC